MTLIVDNPLLALFAIIGSGVLLGAVRIGNVSLGSSGIIFSSLGMGLLGATVPVGAETLGLVLFAYAVGVSAGPGFFRVFARQGARLAKLGLFITTVGAATAWALAMLWRLPAGLTAGIFAGALTSTPALAAALDVVADDAAVSVGYGVAYPCGVVLVVLFVQIVPWLLGIDLQGEAKRIASDSPKINRILLEVLNPALAGRRIEEISFLNHHRCTLSRMLDGDRLVPVTPDTTLQQNMVVLAVGEPEALNDLVELIGKRSEHRCYIDADTRKKVVLTSRNVLGKRIGELNLLSVFGLSIFRMSRQGVDFAPGPKTLLQQADILTVEGPCERIEEFKRFAGHRKRVLNETDIAAVAIGILSGLVLGMVPIALPGMKGFSLGLAGGPLISGLVMSHFGNIGRIHGYIPPAARLMLMNLGLTLFLAGAGIKAGGRIVEIFSVHGPMLLLTAAIIVIVPMVSGYGFARKVLKLSHLEILGGICGGMTSTPGLGSVNESVDSEIPAMSYAAAYPVALILMTLCTQILVRLLR